MPVADAGRMAVNAWQMESDKKMSIPGGIQVHPNGPGCPIGCSAQITFPVAV